LALGRSFLGNADSLALGTSFANGDYLALSNSLATFLKGDSFTSSFPLGYIFGYTFSGGGATGLDEAGAG